MSSTRVVDSKDDRWLPEALAVLQSGGLVAMPTDTVYGLGCDVFNALAIERLYEAKGRIHDKAIPILAANLEQLSRITLDASAELTALDHAFWPGPLTVVIEKAPGLPQILSQGPTVGVRIPNHPVALALMEAWGPLAVTSANLSGAGSCQTPEAVLEQLDGRFDLLIDGGDAPGGDPSTVIAMRGSDLSLLRAGPIPFADIRKALRQANLL